MKLSTLLTISAVVASVFGLAFVLVSGPLLSLYDITLNQAGTVVAQLFGAAIIGFAVLNWFSRNVEDSKARRAFVLGNLAADAVGFVMILLGQLAGVANALGWSSVAIYLLLALGFGYFQFMKPGVA